jgi:hypothetical protein
MVGSMVVFEYEALVSVLEKDVVDVEALVITATARHLDRCVGSVVE